MTIAWTEATAASRRELEQFVCADPPSAKWDPHRGKHHPTRWALVVQSYIRGLRTPLRGCTTFVGHRGGSLVAVAVVEHPTKAAPYHFICAVARSVDYRGAGGGDALLELVGDFVRSWNAARGTNFPVLCKVHFKNDASINMVTRHEFAHVGDDGDYQVWARTF